ncbi:MAG: hypothetical protein PHV36_02430 [Elusimicrobiales bacterium]|nr:hypothetical protein [Elusimicrobiales bacterium]
MGTVDSKEFGLLLAHFLGSPGAPLSAPAAAWLSGFRVGTALSVLQLLEREGILRSRRRAGRRFFSAAAGSEPYRRCRLAHAAHARQLN